jgi:hypothetical protein
MKSEAAILNLFDSPLAITITKDLQRLTILKKKQLPRNGGMSSNRCAYKKYKNGSLAINVYIKKITPEC